MGNVENYKARKAGDTADKKSFWKFPELAREHRIELLERLQQGARWDFSFGLLTGLSAAIASLGLILGSAAVVIGAMVVAPLMTPLIAAGMALVQGNFVPFRTSLITMARGVLLALAVAFFIGVVVPRSDLSGELLARATPNLLDLVVAFLAGFAAAYALALPQLLGALAGVAIAVALVPPLATTGIALSDGVWAMAEGAGLLFLSNLIAIVLGAATVFRCLGVRGASLGKGDMPWIRRSLLVMVLGMFMLSGLLGHNLLVQLTVGQSRPSSYPLTGTVISEINAYLSNHRNIRFVVGHRRINPDGHTEFDLFLSTNRPVENNFRSMFAKHMEDYIGGGGKVRMHIFREAEGSEADIYQAGPEGKIKRE